MRRNIMEALNATPDGKQSLNGFSLGNFETFHQKGGQFNVVGFRQTVPNSDYRMSVDGFTRTLICNTANFAHIKENYYFIHVPFGLVSRNAYQMLVNRKQAYSAVDMGIEQMPVFSLGTILKEIFDVCLSNAQQLGLVDVHGFNLGDGALKLFDMLGYGNYLDLLEWVKAADPVTDPSDTIAARLATAKLVLGRLDGKYVTATALCAYQCAWYHYFRNDVYDNSVSASCFNLDDITVPVNGSVDYDILHHRTAIDFIRECCQLRYVGYKKDIFMSGMPGTQYGPVGTVYINDPQVQVRFVGSSGGVLASGTSLTIDTTSGGNIKTTDNGNTYYANTSMDSSGSTVRSFFDVLQLVEQQAIQKWRQKSMLAGNKTADQFRAHHGEVPRHLIDHLPDFIGSVDNEIHISEITSTSDTATSPDESNLGNIAGRGYGVTENKVFNFHSDDYGYLFLIHAIVPENTYNSFGLSDAHCRVYYSDFFQTEYQNIGLEPVPKTLLNALDAPASGTPVPAFKPHESQAGDTISTDVGIFSYAPRNFGYKEYVSKCHGLFCSPRQWLSGLYPWYNNPNKFGFADFASFVLARADMVLNLQTPSAGADRPNSLAFTLSKLYVHPSIFDSLFAQAADDTQLTDEFFSHVRFNCDASLPMSVLGIPKF